MGVPQKTSTVHARVASRMKSPCIFLLPAERQRKAKYQGQVHGKSLHQFLFLLITEVAVSLY